MNYTVQKIEITETGNCAYMIVGPTELSAINTWLNLLPYDVRVGKYAFRICQYINWCEEFGKIYEEATLNDLHEYLFSLRFDDNKIFGLHSNQTRHLEVISCLQILSSMYLYLEEHKNKLKNDADLFYVDFDKEDSLVNIDWKDHFIYEIANEYRETFNPNINYRAWYNHDQLHSLYEQISTYRDKAIFLLLQHAIDLDDLFSLHLSDYNAESQTIAINPGYPTERIIHLSEKTNDMLQQYLKYEHSMVKVDLREYGYIAPRNLFIVIEKNSQYGTPMTAQHFKHLFNGWCRSVFMPNELTDVRCVTNTSIIQDLLRCAEDPDTLTINEILKKYNWDDLCVLSSYLYLSNPLLTKQQKALLAKLKKRVYSIK